MAHSHLGQPDTNLQLRHWGGDVNQVRSSCFPSLKTLPYGHQQWEMTIISSTVRCLQHSWETKWPKQWCLVPRWHGQEVTQQEFSQRCTWALPGTHQKSKTGETSQVLSGTKSSAIAVFETIQIYSIGNNTIKSQNSWRTGSICSLARSFIQNATDFSHLMQWNPNKRQDTVEVGVDSVETYFFLAVPTWMSSYRYCRRKRVISSGTEVCQPIMWLPAGFWCCLQQLRPWAEQTPSSTCIHKDTSLFSMHTREKRGFNKRKNTPF